VVVASGYILINLSETFLGWSGKEIYDEANNKYILSTLFIMLKAQ